MTSVWNSGGFTMGTAEATVLAHEFGLQRLLDGIQAAVDQGGAKLDLRQDRGPVVDGEDGHEQASAT